MYTLPNAYNKEKFKTSASNECVKWTFAVYADFGPFVNLGLWYLIIRLRFEDRVVIMYNKTNVN